MFIGHSQIQKHPFPHRCRVFPYICAYCLHCSNMERSMAAQTWVPWPEGQRASPTLRRIRILERSQGHDCVAYYFPHRLYQRGYSPQGWQCLCQRRTSGEPTPHRGIMRTRMSGTLQLLTAPGRKMHPGIKIRMHWLSG